MNPCGCQRIATAPPDRRLAVARCCVILMKHRSILHTLRSQLKARYGGLAVRAHQIICGGPREALREGDRERYTHREAGGRTGAGAARMRARKTAPVARLFNACVQFAKATTARGVARGQSV